MDPDRSVDHGPTFRLVCELFERLESHRHDDARLRSLVQRRLLEEYFVHEGGDPVMDPACEIPLQLKVEIIMSVLHALEKAPQDRKTMTQDVTS